MYSQEITQNHLIAECYDSFILTLLIHYSNVNVLIFLKSVGSKCNINIRTETRVSELAAAVAM